MTPGHWAVVMAAVAFAGAIAIAAARTPDDGIAGKALRDRAAREAGATPILADPLHAEALALDGRRILVGNPLDAFPRRVQGLYLDWASGRPAGDALLRQARVALVRIGEDPQRRLSGNPAFPEVARDADAVLYVRR
jgi:hypothetical protein